MHSCEQLVVIFAGAPFAGVRRSARSLSEALSHHVNVLYVDPTASPIDRDQRTTLRPRLNRISAGLYQLDSVTIPAHTRTGVRRLSRSAVVAAVSRAIDRIRGGPPFAVMLQTPQLDVLGRFGESNSVYWATDAFAAGSRLMGVARETMLEAEASAASRADLVIAVSDGLAKDWADRGKRVVVVRHGVDPMPPTLSPSEAPADLTLPRPIAGVVGTLSERLDFEVLDSVADVGVSVVLIGPASFRTDHTAFDRFCSRPNVNWLGEKDYTALAPYLEHLDVGLVPYTLSAFNMLAAPLKPLEYLAAGLPVVSTPLPGVADIDSPDITLVDTPIEFALAAIQAAEIGKQSDLADRRRAHVSTWNWDVRALEVLDILLHNAR